MKRPLLALLAAAALLLTACNTNLNTIPDVTVTAQVIVVHLASQTVELSDGACDSINVGDPAVAPSEAHPTARVYYGLPPGTYCLQWGDTFSGGYVIRGAETFEFIAGSLQTITVVPTGG